MPDSFGNPNYESPPWLNRQDAEKQSDSERRPAFSFEDLSNERAYSFDGLDKKQKALFASTLHVLGRMTWAEIRNSHRHKNGHEIILRDSLKVTVPDHVTPDVNILAFRCFDKAPMLGYKDGHIFKLLWLDPNMKCYDHG